MQQNSYKPFVVCPQEMKV